MVFPGEQWLEQAVLFHAVSQSIAADAKEARRPDLIARREAQGLLNELLFQGRQAEAGLGDEVGSDTMGVAAGLAGDFLRQLVCRDGVSASQNHRPFYSVAQLSHVSRPVVFAQQKLGFRRDPGYLSRDLLPVSVYEVFGEKQDVLAALTQGRDSNLNYA